MYTLFCLGMLCCLQAQTPDPDCGTNDCATAIDIELTGDPWVEICAEEYCCEDCFNQEHTYYSFTAPTDGYLQFCYGGANVFSACNNGKPDLLLEAQVATLAECGGDGLQYFLAANTVAYIRVDRIDGIAGTDECALFRFLPGGATDCECRNYLSSVAQPIRCEDFEAYREEALTTQSPLWELCEADAGDGWISQEQVYGNGAQSLLLTSEQNSNSNLVYDLGDHYQGNLQLSWWMFVPEGHSADYALFYNPDKQGSQRTLYTLREMVHGKHSLWP